MSLPKATLKKSNDAAAWHCSGWTHWLIRRGHRKSGRSADAGSDVRIMSWLCFGVSICGFIVGLLLVARIFVHHGSIPRLLEGVF